MSGILAAMPDAFGQSAPHPTLSGVAADQVVDLDIVVGQFFQDQLQIPGRGKDPHHRALLLESSCPPHGSQNRLTKSSLNPEFVVQGTMRASPVA